METCRLRVKIGPYEMEAEGPRDFVEKHYGSFAERIPETNQLAVPQSKPPIPFPEQAAEVGRASQFSPIFQQEGKLVSLTARGDSSELDGALVVLLGHKELRGADLVSADELLYGLKQSGYGVERADRIAGRGEEQGLITRSGVRRGTRYRLTNQGMIAARSIASEMLSRVM